MTVSDVIKIIEAEYPTDTALDWDNVGLLVGDADAEVKKILLALDATDDVIAQAVACQADLLITHHPLIFKGIRRVTTDDFVGRRVLTLAKQGISYYAMHTNYDVGGMGKEAAARMGLKETSLLEETVIGIKGVLEQEMSLQEFSNRIKQKFALETIHVFGELTHIIDRVAVVPGSGGSDITEALEAGVDVLVTGDIDHHEGMDAALRGLAVIDAGHFGLEHIFAEAMERFLRQRIPAELPIIRAEETAPYRVI